jgi:hypothetical protein
MIYAIEWDPMPHQERAFLSQAKYTGLIGGYGCGKTNWLVHKLFELASQNEGLRGGILAPDLKQFKRDFLPEAKSVARKNSIRLSWKPQDSTIVIPATDSEIYVFHDQDKGESIQGPNIAYGLVNEVTKVSKDGFDAFDARVRLKEARRMQIAFSGTPDIETWVHEEFVETERPDAELFNGKTKDNIYVHESYYKRLYDAYDPTMRKQYLDGEWVSLGGSKAAWEYDASRHLQDLGIEPDGERAVWVSLDFNVEPMAATIWLRGNIEDPFKLYAWDNVKLNNSNTPQMARVLEELVGLEVRIYPDPAGDSRNTKVDYNDIQILREAGFEEILYKKRIKSVRRCLFAMNKLFADNQIFIHPRCKELRKDLDRVKMDSTGTVLDKSDSDRTHWLDGFKNMCDFEFPVVDNDELIKVRRRG